MALEPTAAATPVGDSASLAVAWNNLLSIVSLLNLLFWLRRVYPSATGLSLSWLGVWPIRGYLALMYVTACGIRSIWPRIGGDRVCFWDHPLSPPLVGRSLAFVAELCFAALICMALVRINNTPTVRFVASSVFACNWIAQIACTYSVITRDRSGHVLEESIWTVSAIAVFLVALFARSAPSPSSQATSFRRALLVLCPLYILFMVTVDVPMYYRRMVADNELGVQFASITAGLAEIAACQTVTQSDAYWREEMPWMTGYFTAGVWSTLWIATATIDPHLNTAQAQKKHN
jgi:hypothetical protein